MKKKILSLLLAFMMLVPASSVLARDNSNHNWSDWYVDTYPDCGNSRQKSRLCYDYNEVQHRSIPVIKKHEQFITALFLVVRKDEDVRCAFKSCFACGKQKLCNHPPDASPHFTNKGEY